MQLGIIRQTVGAGGEGEDLIVTGHFHIIIVEGKILGLFDEAIEGGIGGVGVDVVELDIGVEYRKYLPDHVLFDGGVVDIRMGLGKILVLILQQLSELGAVCVVLIIGQQGIFGPAQIVAVDDGILRDGGAIAAGAAEIGIVAAVVIVLTIGIAAQVVLVIIVIIDLDHHIIDGGAINIQPADGILVLLLHGQRIFQHGLLQFLEDLLLGGLIGIGVIRIGGGSGIAGIGRIGGVAGVFAAGGKGKYHAECQQQGQQACCRFHNVPRAFSCKLAPAGALFRIILHHGGGACQ